MVDLIQGGIGIVTVAVSCKVLHKKGIDAAAAAVGDILGPGLQFFPLPVGEHSPEVEHIVHAGIAQLRGFAGLDGLGLLRLRREVRGEIVRRRRRHGIYCLTERIGAHGHIRAVPRPRRHIRLHRVIHQAGEFLPVAPRLAQHRVDAPVGLRQGVRTVRQRLQQQRQRNAVLFLAPAVAGIFVNICGDVSGGGTLADILVGKYVHPQVKVKRLRQLG